MAAERSRPSDLVLQTVGPIAESLIDLGFASTPLIAPTAGLAALYLALRGARWPAYLAGLIAGGAVVGVYARFVAPWQLRVTRLELGFSNPLLRVVFFSDLHLGKFKRSEWLHQVVEAVNAQSPDLVLIGGDFLGRARGFDIAELLQPLRRLRARRGVYAVLGNHDYGLHGPDHSAELMRLLPQLNIRLLRNECALIGDGLWLVGVDELWMGHDDLPAAIAACQSCGCSERMLVFGHNPDLMLTLERSPLAETVFIFGHTHHGQIHIPLLPGLAVPVRSRFYRGLYRTKHGPVYVSSGCGEHHTLTRLNTWPEIVVFEI
jgi:predicted MPP superfamily phosphohydrolase